MITKIKKVKEKNYTIKFGLFECTYCGNKTCRLEHNYCPNCGFQISGIKEEITLEDFISIGSV